ncbi:hypothetical protein KP509_27G034500 [Ceratopteris richardii]|uniref:Uncharacterized protein n=1 Tax=Ceratopteris richardii TaxID=49495 RepID=A0A8T2RGW8_CERRI|nr:hypothetical protein KP509_27G034500 [Ceratopteris richardii]
MRCNPVMSALVLTCVFALLDSMPSILAQLDTAYAVAPGPAFNREERSRSSPQDVRRLLFKVAQCRADEDIQITQGSDAPTPDLIPLYSVSIVNLCGNRRCVARNVHVACGMFASSQLVDPAVFRRVAFNDCLVNSGRPIGSGESIHFVYGSNEPIDLRILSAEFACA